MADVQFNIGGSGGMPRGTLQTMLDGFEGKMPKREKGDPRFYPKEYKSVASNALSISSFLLPRYQMGMFTGPNFMMGINVPVLCRAAPTLGFSSEVSISDRMVLTKPSLLNGYGLLPAAMYITTLVLGGMAMALPPVRGWFRARYLKGYSYDGNPAARVRLQTRGASADGKSSALARCTYPGDPGIYATGLLATAVANSLLKAAASEHPPPAGFNSPVAAFSTCSDGLLVENLKSLGATIEVEVSLEDGMSRVVDASKLRSKL